MKRIEMAGEAIAVSLGRGGGRQTKNAHLAYMCGLRAFFLGWS